LGLRSKLVAALSLLLAGSVWFYVKGVLIPHQVVDAATLQRPRGNLSDLYPRWLGARELLLRHRDPYSAEVTREIQSGYYGRPIDPTRPNDPTDEQRFAYPIYVVFLLAPTIKLPFTAIEPVFRWMLIVLVLGTALAWMRLLHWRPSRATYIAVLALAVGNFPSVQGILLEQLTIVVSAMLAACLLALVSDRLLLAGCLLALATIKPQLAWPLAAWLTLWTLHDWKKRQRFLWGFCVTGAALALGAELVLPGWISEFRDAITAYQQYTHAQSVVQTLTSPTIGAIINWLILVGIALICWRARRIEAKTDAFVAVSSLVLAATVVVVPALSIYNHILLFPSVFLLLRNWDLLWNANPLTRGVGLVAVSSVLWPWVTCLALLAATSFVPLGTIQRAWAVPLFSSLAIPVSVLALFGLYIRRAL
jgi:hypothetical protein